MSKAEETVQKILDIALPDLIQTMEGYQSKLSTGHVAALRGLLTDYAMISLGLKQGRTAWPLPVGCGKTQSIVSFISACHQLGLTGVSVLISEEKIEALCDLKRDLMAKGVPEDVIGLEHSKKFSVSEAGTIVDGEHEAPKPGYASLPRTPDYAERPFLLMTHEKLKITRHIADYNTFNGDERSLLIWDESLLKSRGRHLLVSDVDDSLGVLQRRVDGGSNSMAAEVSSYLSECFEALSDADGKALTFPTKTDAEREAYKRVVREVLNKDSRGMNHMKVKCLTTFVDFTQETLRRVDVGQSRGLITYSLLIPDHLQRVVILDASHVIRALVKEDKTIMAADNYETVKMFSNVQIKQLKQPGGWHTMGEIKAGAPQIKALVDDLLKQTAGDAILIFTYKPKGYNTNHRKFIESALRQQGVDPDQMVEVEVRGELVQRHRFNWLTWGRETGLSKFSFCTHVYAFGIYRRSLVDLSASLAGQLTNLNGSKVENHSTLKEIERTEMFHCLLQACGRGSERETIEGEAKPMKASFIAQEDFSDLFELAMPGATIEEWVSPHFPKDGIVESAVVRINEALKRISPKSDEVAVRILKVNSDSSEVNRRTFNKAINIVGQTNKLWRRERRSFVRVDCGFGMSAAT